jgi:hypothetical protein
VNNQLDLFDVDDPPMRFDGETYEPEHDQVRLSGQTRRVFGAMRDGQWRTLGEIESITGDPQASVSARLRDLRKDRFGGHEVNRRRRGAAERGLFEYQLVASEGFRGYDND